MNRFAKLALAAAALSLTALSAAPASATDITVSLKGKSNEQIVAEVQSAAMQVCRADTSNLPLSSLTACATDLARDTLLQVPGFQK